MKRVILSLLMIFGASIYMNNAANKEIEIKFTLSDTQFVQLKQWLEANAQYVREEKQEELYFNNPEPSQTFYFKSKHGYIDALKALRVRKTNKGDTVCYKYSNIDKNTGKILYKNECETKVPDGKVFVEIFENMGFTDKIQVKKTRNIYTSGDFEIVIDNVEKLGTFVEVELKREYADAQAGIAAINNFIKSMGITSYMQFNRSYIHMFTNPGYNFSELVLL